MSALCVECHTEVQSELGDSSALHGALGEAGACLACHTEHGGATASLTRFQGKGLAHDRFGFSLAGHRKAADAVPFRCLDCHSGPRFSFDGATCLTCHNAYQAAFVTRHESDWGSDCRACHDGLDRFSRTRFSHDTTRYPLTGQHRRTACADCHAGARAPAAFRLGRTDCIACHRQDDTHQGEFGADCAACHGTDSWSEARFEHIFPLEHGEGGRVTCRTCHLQGASYRSYTCYGCHEHTPERIQREHDEEGIENLANCVRCHRTGSEHEGDRGRERHERGGHQDDD